VRIEEVGSLKQTKGIQQWGVLQDAGSLSPGLPHHWVHFGASTSARMTHALHVGPSHNPSRQQSRDIEVDLWRFVVPRRDEAQPSKPPRQGQAAGGDEASDGECGEDSDEDDD
jgi:hypothetical protein